MNDVEINENTLVSGDALGLVLGLSKMRISQLGTEGVLPKNGRKYFLSAGVQAYIQRFVDRKSNQNADYEVEKARKMAADADISEVKAAKAKGKVVDVEYVQETVIGIGSATKARLKQLESTLPPMLEGKKPSDMRLLIRGEIDKVLKALSDESPSAWQQPPED